MALRRTEGCHGNFVISHVKLQVIAEFRVKIKEWFVTYDISEVMGLVSRSRKSKMKNVHLPKTSLLVQIGEDISNVMLPMAPYKSFYQRPGSLTLPSKPIVDICMESSEQIGACIYPPICTNKLIFDKGPFHLFFLNIPTNPRISQIWIQSRFLYFYVYHPMFIIRGGILVHLRIRYLTVI